MLFMTNHPFLQGKAVGEEDMIDFDSLQDICGAFFLFENLLNVMN